jgi:hypothetical protein
MTFSATPMSPRRQNLLLAMAAPCARAPSLAIDRGHDVVTAHEIGVATDALGNELRVLDVG